MLDLPTPALIGVIHLPPLPGSPRHSLGMGEIVDRARRDTHALSEAGFDAAIIENFGDAPFYPGRLPAETVAAMTVVADRVRQVTSMRIGVNALRNDARAALAIAATTGASFIRVNIHSGAYATDQGVIEGEAYETLRHRNALGARIAILADVHVKHATPLGEPDLARAARDTAYRGLADGLIVTGRATGESVAVADVQRVREAVSDRRIFVGSGATAENIGELLRWATGVIVGSGIKRGGDPSEPIDANRAGAFVRAAGRG